MHEWKEAIAEFSPETLFADGHEEAFLGYVDKWDVDGNRRIVAVYSYEKCIEGLVKQGMTEGEAEEFFDFNTQGAYVGPHTPLFLRKIDS